MATTLRLDGAAYERLVADDPAYEDMELFDGVPVEKPAMCWYHGDLGSAVGLQIASMLDQTRFRLRFDHARLALPGGDSYYIPDLAIIPNTPPPTLRALDLHCGPIPLVVEIWAPRTGPYDAAVKLPGYRRRGDAEVWWFDPRDPSVTRWLRRPDGEYDEEVRRGGVVELTALPTVRIDLDALFAGLPGRDR